MTRRSRRSLAVLAFGVLAAAAAGCSGDHAPPAAPAPGTGVAEGPPSDAAVPDDAGSRPPPRILVQIYFPSSEAMGLVGEEREIFHTAAPGDRAKQIVTDLISGPSSKLALRALPQGTRLRQIYVLDDGTAYVDFSEDLREGLGGGSAEELITVYAIVNSVAMNVTEIRRVGILIEGKPIDTLNGHLDLRRPLTPDLSLLLARAEFV